MTSLFASRLLARSGVAAGPKAAAAYVRWLDCARRAPHAQPMSASVGDDAVETLARRFPVGRAVWVRGPDGVAYWRGHILAHDLVSGRALVADIDRPHAQTYVGIDRMAVRFAGDRQPSEHGRPHRIEIGQGGVA
jgi:hypothetical protein